MKQILIIIFSVFITLNLLGQEKNRVLIWFGPVDNVNVHGLNIAPLVFKIPTNTQVNGINIEGVGIPLLLFMIPIDPTEGTDNISIRNDFCVNGISLSPAGLIHPGVVNGLAVTPLFSHIDQVNGANLSLFFNISDKFNGLAISLNNSTIELKGVQIGLFNKAEKAKGLQVGIFNKSNKFKGVQIGLWNINEKRKLPIINWSKKTSW